MKHPRMILAAVAAAVALPLLTWVGIASSASVDPSTSAPASITEPLPASTVEPQVAGGDRVTPVVEPSATPSPAATVDPRPDPLAITQIPTVTPTPDSSPSPTVKEEDPRPSPSSTPRPDTPSATPTPSKPAKPAKPAPSTPEVKPMPPTSPKATKPAKRRETTSVRGQWSPPDLVVGTNVLSFPVLTSDADVTITVACQPTDGCDMNGGLLTIEPGSTVTVTWSAPRTRTHTAWSVQRTFN